MPKKRSPGFGTIDGAFVSAALYEGWDKDLAEEGKRIVEQLRRRTEAFIIDTGRDLIALKDRLEHGQFVPWVENGLGMKIRTAQNYMVSAAAFRDQSETISHLPPATIYKLATAPEPIRLSVLKRMEAGNALTSNEILDEVRAAREQDRKRREQERENERVAKLSPRERAAEKARGRRASARTRDEEAEREALRNAFEGKAALLREACAILLESFGAVWLAAFTDRFREVSSSVMYQAEAAALAELAKSQPITELALADIIRLSHDPSSKEKTLIHKIAGSIKISGVYDPLQVRKVSFGGYVILDGQRRFQALVNVLGHSIIRVQIAPILKELPAQ